MKAYEGRIVTRKRVWNISSQYINNKTRFVIDYERRYVAIYNNKKVGKGVFDIVLTHIIPFENIESIEIDGVIK